MYQTGDRYTLKQNAKASMRKVRGIYLVSLVALILTSAPNLVIRFSSVGSSILHVQTVEEMIYAYRNMMGVGSALMLVTLLLNIFLALVSAGYTLYTLRISRGEDPGGMETLFACFQQFWRFFAANLLMGLFTFLWSLLFIIPGIIAAFAYSQTIYVMLDHPEMSAMEAIRTSKELMRGHKAEYFVLQLSFFGWALLAGMTFGILNIWLMPYENVTFGNYYNALTGWQPAGAAEEEPQPETQWWES